MPTHRPLRVGVVLLGVTGLAGSAWGQAAPSAPAPAPPDRRSAYEGFVPLLERDEPHPSFWGETGPSPDAEPAEAAAEPSAPPAADGEQVARDGEEQP